MLGGAMMLLTGCNKTEVQPTPPDSETEKNFNVETTALTQGSISVRITPVDNEEPYYFGVVTKKDFASLYKSDAETLQEAYIKWFEEMAGKKNLNVEEFLSQALLTGMQNYQFRALDPQTDYLFFVFGVSYENEPTTTPETFEFKTRRATLKKDAVISITEVEKGSTWFKVKFDCNDPDIFYYGDVMLPDIYEQYCGSNPDNIPAYVKDYLTALKAENDEFKAMSMAQFISYITVNGESEYDTALTDVANSLLPEMEYPVFAIGIANDGSFTTEPVVKMVRTGETKRNNWILDDKKVTDIQYDVTVYPAYDEVYAAILERDCYFEGLSDEQCVNELLAARKGSFMADLITGRGKLQFNNLIPNEDYTLFLIACTPDGLPKTGDKLNVKKDPVKTLEATPTNAVYSVKAYSVTKTSAKVSVSGNDAASGQTYMLNYISKARLIELATKEEEANGGNSGGGSESGSTGAEGGSIGEGSEGGETGSEGGEVTPIVPSEASFQTLLKRDCDEFIDASLKAWNDNKPNAQMDRKEFLSRALLSDVGVGTSYSWDGLTPGTEYVAYAIGLKADGTYTTKAYTTEFKTIEDIQSQIRLDVGMKAWVYEEYYPNKTNYTVAATGEPYNQVQGVYCKSFIENDEWAEKTGAEIEELLKKEQAGLYGSISAPLTVERGKTFFVYFIGVDKEGISTHVSKVTHTSRVEGGDNGMAKTVKIDKLETIPVR
jgi:hypothetical protein